MYSQSKRGFIYTKLLLKSKNHVNVKFIFTGTSVLPKSNFFLKTPWKKGYTKSCSSKLNKIDFLLLKRNIGQKVVFQIFT